jgi:Fe-S cluster assembly protein SufD
MTNFLDTATHWIEGQSDAAERRTMLAEFATTGIPKTTDEVWRYAPLEYFNLDQYVVDAPLQDHSGDALENSIATLGAVVVRTHNGVLQGVEGQLDGVTVETTKHAGSITGYEDDSFVVLNGALTPGTIELTVTPGSEIRETIVILHTVTAGAAFPRLKISLGKSASARVIEIWSGGLDSLVVPVSEYHLDENSSLNLATYQRLDLSAWYVSRTTTTLGRDARMHQSVIGMGAAYDRARNDAVFQGTGAQNELWTTYLGRGTQVHDLRSHQLHNIGRTASRLLSKGAVAEESRSIYTGLIEIERGARRTDARQTNHNLLLSPHAHADTVPNLDIRENDVTCAHASSVGPLDELQRWYLESRGVSRHDAERLMIQGFFNEMLDVLPRDVASVIEADIASQLDGVVVV